MTPRKPDWLTTTIVGLMVFLLVLYGAYQWTGGEIP